MKKIFLLLFTLGCLGMQPVSADTTDSLNALYARTEAISDSLQQLNDSIAQLKIQAAITQFYDSGAVQQAKADPMGTIYKYEWKWRGKYFNVSPFGMSLIILIIVFLSFRLVTDTGFLRDGGRDQDGNLLPVKQRPFSYSRAQLFWWTMIVLTCFIVFFTKTWYLLPLNVTCIVLLGLGAVVHIGGRMIDNRDREDAAIPDGTRKQDKVSRHHNFFRDLLSDGAGPSIHRFQSLVFNLLFGIGFVIFFGINLAAHQYPLIDFSEWQLALLGISSATYLGVKATENTPSSAGSRHQGTASDTDNEPQQGRHRNPADYE